MDHLWEHSTSQRLTKFYAIGALFSIVVLLSIFTIKASSIYASIICLILLILILFYIRKVSSRSICFYDKEFIINYYFKKQETVPYSKIERTIFTRDGLSPYNVFEIRYLKNNNSTKQKCTVFLPNEDNDFVQFLIENCSLSKFSAGK
jgi:hypothetical protein